MSQASDLEKKIRTAIRNIKGGITTPAKSSIGKLLKYLKEVDEAAHENLMREYKIVFEEWKGKQE